MKLVLQCPTDDFKGEAEAAWSAFLERVPKPPIQVTEVQFETSKEPLTGAIAEVPPWSRPTIRLSERFFGLESSLQTVTLLHETIHHSLLLDKTSQRMDRVQEWSKPYTYLRASSSEERDFNEQRVLLAKVLYLFPEEVMAEKHLSANTMDTWLGERTLGLATRHPIHPRGKEVATMTDVYEKLVEFPRQSARDPDRTLATARSRCWQRRLGVMLASENGELSSCPQGVRKPSTLRLSWLLSPELYQRVTALGRRLLAAESDPPSWDEDAAVELFNLVVSIQFEPAAE